MIEHTELIEDAAGPVIEVQRASAPGQFISYAGSDIAQGETLLRRLTLIGSREIGMLAACGLADVDVVRKPKVAVLSTGDELVPPGGQLGPAAIYDSNGAILAAVIAGRANRCPRVFPDDETILGDSLRRRSVADMVSCRAARRKRGRPLASYRLRSARPSSRPAVAAQARQSLCPRGGRKPVACCPLPDVAIFTFLHLSSPVVHALRWIADGCRQGIRAKCRSHSFELGRKDFVLVSLLE